MKSRYLLPILLLVVAIVIGNQLLPSSNTTEEDARKAGTVETPDFYLTGFKTETFNTRGHLDSTVSGNELTYYDQTERSTIRQPILDLFDKEQGDWQITGQQAVIDADEQMIFGGAVQIEREAKAGQTPIAMVTRDLVVDRPSDEASTEAEVELNSNRQLITATGMKLRFRDPARIDLLANVKAEYAPRN